MKVDRKTTIAQHLVNLAEPLRKNYPGKYAGFTNKGLIAVADTRQGVEDKLLEIGSVIGEYEIVTIDRQ